MSLVIEDPQVERLAKQIAAAEGTTVPEVLRASLLSQAALRGLAASKQAPLSERLAALAREVDALPPKVPLDTRSDNEVLGYNEHGVW